MTELPKGWVSSRLADVADVRLGRQRSPKNATGDRMRPYLRAANVKWAGLDLSDVNEMAFTAAESQTYELRPGDLLLGEASGSPSEVGKPGQYKGEIEGCCFQNTLLRVRLPDELLPDFYEHYFREQALNGRFAAGSRGVGIRHLGAAALSDWTIPVPPSAEQERIVTAIEEAFSKLDAGEAGLRTVRQLLKRMREAILNAAATGRLVPQDPTDTPAAKLLADLGVEALEAKGAAGLPPGWVWGQLGDLSLTVRNGVFVSRPAENPPGVPILRIGAIRPLHLEWSDVRYAPVDIDDPTIARGLLAEGDLLFTRYNGNPAFVGACALVSRVPGPVLHPDKLIRVAIDRRAADPAYVAIAASTGWSREFISAATKTTAGQAGISGGELKQVPVPLAPIEEQTRIVAEVERQLSFVEACERAVDVGLARAAGLRRSVLKAAFEGRLVPQDPSDEPASVLLDRIRAERSVQPVAKRRARQTA